MASVTIKPSNFNFFLNNSLVITEDKVAGFFERSIPGVITCAVITIFTPFFTEDLNGGNSILEKSFLFPGIIGNRVWLSVAVLPCPGKCLTQA